MADFGAMFTRATMPEKSKRVAAADPYAGKWIERVAVDVQDVRTLAALNAARVGIAGVERSKVLSENVPQPFTVMSIEPMEFELERLAKRAETKTAAYNAAGKRQQKVYVGQSWKGHALPGVIEALKSQGVALVAKDVSTDTGDVFVSMQVPRTPMVVQLPEYEIDVRSVATLMFTPAGITKLVKGLTKDAGFRALVEAFAKEIDGAEDPAVAIREVSARAKEIEALARTTAS